MIYKYDLINRGFYRDDIRINESCIILGRYLGDEQNICVLRENCNKNDIYNSIYNSPGNFARICSLNDGLSIITTPCFHIYYCIKENFVYFSDLMIDVENCVASSGEIDFDSLFYYIASGNFPPLKYSFWKNLNKVSGEHDVTINLDGDVKDEKWTFKLLDCVIHNKKQEYDDIMSFEAKGIKNYLGVTGKKAYCLVSGVDSFNSFLALHSEAGKIVAIHNNVNEIQKSYVKEFIKEYQDVDYIEVDNSSYTNSFTAQDIINCYKKTINPFIKMATDNCITEYINKCEVNAIEITGDFAGLTMAIKAFNSTLNQHSFYGRHFLGAVKRSYYKESKYLKANKKLNKGGRVHSLYNFMTSMFLPTKNFDSLIPYKSLVKAPGLSEEEKNRYIEIVHKYIESYALSVKWDTRTAYSDNVGKLFRSYKRELYMPGLPLMNEIRMYLYGIERFFFFASTKACVYEDNYCLDFFNDIFRSKKCVYDYFDNYHPISIVKLAKNALKNKDKISLKKRFALIVLFPARFVPEKCKKGKVYQFIRNHLFSIRKNAGAIVDYDTQELSLSENDMLNNMIIFSDFCEDKVMKQYFINIENRIKGKDILSFSPVEERYMALSVYMKERTRFRDTI